MSLLEHPEPSDQPVDSIFWRANFIALLIIAGMAAILLLPIFLRGFPDGADTKYHYRWAYYFCEALRWTTQGLNRAIR